MTDFIYSLEDPEGNVRYIGKTRNPDSRLRAHVQKARSFETKNHAANWIRSLLAKGKRPVLKIVFEVPKGEDWQPYEKSFIAEYRKIASLTNSAEGGTGVSGLPTELLNACRAKANATKRLPQNRRRSSETLKAICSTEEWKEQQSRRSRDMYEKPGYREKISSAFKGSDRQRKMQEGITPEVIARRAESLRKTCSSPEFKEAHSLKMKEVWAKRKADKLAKVTPIV